MQPSSGSSSPMGSHETPGSIHSTTEFNFEQNLCNNFKYGVPLCFPLLTMKVTYRTQVEVKFKLEKATTTQRWSRRIDLLFL